MGGPLTPLPGYNGEDSRRGVIAPTQDIRSQLPECMNKIDREHVPQWLILPQSLDTNLHRGH